MFANFATSMATEIATIEEMAGRNRVGVMKYTVLPRFVYIIKLLYNL
jgi:hypothetical protein